MVGRLERVAERSLELGELTQVLAGGEAAPGARDHDRAHRVGSLLEGRAEGQRAVPR